MLQLTSKVQWCTVASKVILSIREVLKHFGPEGGSVINISSIALTGSEPMMVVYAATKSEVDAITRVLARELGRRKSASTASRQERLKRKGFIRWVPLVPITKS
jgi:NAD(P)-dependent dehydrogenase (short-subunit alcohol dehydrogenase family)